MKMYISLKCALVFALGLFASCEEERITNIPTTSIEKNLIMPLGASRVEGARPVFESYRYELWKLLIDGGYDFDYIGTQDDEANYPRYNGASFDSDHEGRGGWTSGQILDGLSDWLKEAGTPDIVLLSSPGGNDILSGQSYDTVVQNVNDIVDVLQNVNPNMIIVIEQLAPGMSAIMEGDILSSFEMMQSDVIKISSEQTTGQSKIIVVDMATDFTDELLADDVHYNQAGALFIAERYYEVLQGILEE